MKLPVGQEELISAILDVNEKCCNCCSGGITVELEALQTVPKPIVYTSYNGMEGGRALARVLLGNVNPSGKLPFTFPRCLKDCPAHKLGEFPGDEIVVYETGWYICGIPLL